MEMCYDGALVMPSNYAVMDEEEMTYVEGGAGYWFKQSFTQKANEAYKAMIDSANASWLLAGGCTGGGALLAGPIGAIIGLGLGSAIFAQWADAYYGAADSIYAYRNNTKKTVYYYEALSGLKAYMTVKVTKIV